MGTWLLDGMIRLRFDDELAPLDLKTDTEKEQYVISKTNVICTMVADRIRIYLTNKHMTKREFSERTKISKWRLKRILDGDYGGISIQDFACIQSEFYGEHDVATRIILFEKKQK